MMNVQTYTISNRSLFSVKVAGLIGEVICICRDVVCSTRVREPVGIKDSVRTSHHSSHGLPIWNVGGLEFFIKPMPTV